MKGSQYCEKLALLGEAASILSGRHFCERHALSQEASVSQEAANISRSSQCHKRQAQNMGLLEIWRSWKQSQRHLIQLVEAKESPA